MKKVFILFFTIFSYTFAANGWYNDFISIKVDASTNLYWIGTDPSSGTQLDGANFGVVSSLEITAADMKYWTDAQDRTGGAFYWRIGVVGSNEVIWSQSHLGGNDYQGTWSGSINVLSGLEPSTAYELQIWAKNWGTSGDLWLSNEGANYVATFTTSGAVPVQLTSFTANAISGNTELIWTTATEVNNYGFEIEASDDNSTWNNIGFVEGHGNSNSLKEYSFVVTDNYKYYRLKQVDTDGSFEYSDVVEVEINLNYKLSQNHPNPFNPTTAINFTIPEVSNVKITVYNALGQAVAELANQEFAGGNHSVNFNASNLSSGIYFYRLESSNFSQTMKMTLMK